MSENSVVRDTEIIVELHPREKVSISVLREDITNVTGEAPLELAAERQFVTVYPTL